MNNRDVPTKGCSISRATALRKAPAGPEPTLPGKEGSLNEPCLFAWISAHPSSFSPLIMKFLTVQCVVGVHFLLLIKVLQ